MELILKLGTHALDTLRRTFLQNEGLSEIEFVEAMMYVSDVEAGQEVAFVKASRDAFAQIDVNGDGTLEWDELYAATLEYGAAACDAGGPRPPGATFVELADSGCSHGVTHHVSRVRFLVALDMVVVCTEKTLGAVLYKVPGDGEDVAGQKLGTICTAVPGVCDGGDVYDVVHLEDDNLLALAVGDLTIQFWSCRRLVMRDASHTALLSQAPPCTFVSRSATESPQRILLWVPDVRRLLCAGLATGVILWHIPSRSDGQLAPHDATVSIEFCGALPVAQVSELVFCREIGLVISVDLGGVLCVWAVDGMSDGAGGVRHNNGVFKNTNHSLVSTAKDPRRPAELAKGPAIVAPPFTLIFRDEQTHRHGIRAACYMPTTRLLITAGFEPFARAYVMENCTYCLPRFFDTPSGTS